MNQTSSVVAWEGKYILCDPPECCDDQRKPEQSTDRKMIAVCSTNNAKMDKDS